MEKTQLTPDQIEGIRRRAKTFFVSQSGLILRDSDVDTAMDYMGKMALGEIDPITYQSYLYPVDHDHFDCDDFTRHWTVVPTIVFHNCHNCRNYKTRFGKPVCRKNRQRFKDWRLFKQFIQNYIQS